jgi:hypothetical protein
MQKQRKAGMVSNVQGNGTKREGKRLRSDMIGIHEDEIKKKKKENKPIPVVVKN